MFNPQPIDPHIRDELDVMLPEAMDEDEDMNDVGESEGSYHEDHHTSPPPHETSYPTISNTQPMQSNNGDDVQPTLSHPTHEEQHNYNIHESAEGQFGDDLYLPPLPRTEYTSRYQTWFHILNDPSNMLRHAFLGYFSGDGCHHTDGVASISLRSTDFVWLYRFTRTYGIDQPITFRPSDYISMKTTAVYFGQLQVTMHWFVGAASVYFGMPSSNTHNTNKYKMERYFNMPEPTRRMAFAIYLLTFLDADGSITRFETYSTYTPGYTMTGFVVSQRDRRMLEFIMEMLQQYGYKSFFSPNVDANSSTLHINFANNNDIATQFFRPAMRELILNGYPLSGKLSMVDYCLENDLFANIRMWAPYSLSFTEYCKDLDDDILVVLAEDFRAMNVFDVNMVLEALGLHKLSSTYDIDLTMLKDTLQHIDPSSCTEEQGIAMKYFDTVKQRRTEYTVQEHEYKKTFYYCDHCFYVTDNERSLQIHQQVHDKAKLYVCATCNRHYDDGDHLTQHQKQCHPFEPKPCPFKNCVFTYSTPIQLTKHMEIHRTEGRPFVCSVCHRTYKRNSELKVHKRTHKQERPYKCLHCVKSFTTSSDLSKHYKTSKDHPELNCTVEGCPFTYKCQLHLDEHNERHQEGQPYVCVVCTYGYKKRESFLGHIKGHPDHFQLCAYGCGERFFNAVELESHERDHEQEASSETASTFNNEAN